MGQEVLTLNPNVFLLSQVAWSPDGRRLAAVAPDRIIIWAMVRGP